MLVIPMNTLKRTLDIGMISVSPNLWRLLWKIQIFLRSWTSCSLLMVKLPQNGAFFWPLRDRKLISPIWKVLARHIHCLCCMLLSLQRDMCFPIFRRSSSESRSFGYICICWWRAVGSPEVPWVRTASPWKLWATCRWGLDDRNLWLCWR